MIANPFFCLKIGRLKATVHTVAHQSMKKLVLQIRQILLQLGFKFIGIVGCDSWDMPMVAQPLRELPEPQKMDHRFVVVCAKKQDGKCW
jgi:hypothetical protein